MLTRTYDLISKIINPDHSSGMHSLPVDLMEVDTFTEIEIPQISAIELHSSHQ